MGRTPSHDQKQGDRQWTTWLKTTDYQSLPTSYILVVTDIFNKWVKTFALYSTDTETLATVLFNKVICWYGVPSSSRFSRYRVKFGRSPNKPSSGCIARKSPTTQKGRGGNKFLNLLKRYTIHSKEHLMMYDRNWMRHTDRVKPSMMRKVQTAISL